MRPGRRGVVTPPYGCKTGSAKQQADVGIGPYGRSERFQQPPGPAAHSGASAPAVARKWVEIAAEIIPKVSSNFGQSLSHGCAVPAPFTQGSLWGRGDTDCRVASLLAMTVLILCHSEEAQRADVGIRPFYDGRGFGPPHERRGTARRVVVPYGWLRRAAAIALGSGAQRGVCGAGAKKWAGIAAEIIPKVSSNLGQSLSHGEAVTAPFTQGSLRRRGMRIAASALRASSQ